MSELESTAYRPVPVPGARRSPTGQDLPRVAKFQKWVIGGLLLNVGVMVMNVALPNNAGTLALGLGLMLVAFFVSVLGVVNMMAALRVSVPLRILACVALLLPLINLIVLLVVNGQGTAALKAGGYKVGLLGAKG